MPTDISSSQATYLAIDQGTHATRALLFDRRGKVLSAGEREVSLQRPSPGWAEHDPEEVLASVRAAVEAAIGALGPDDTRLAAVGLATQRSSVVCWDAAGGAALSPIISWQDLRARDWVKQFEPHGEAIRRQTGLFLSPHYGAGKLRWCLDHLPAVRAALRKGTLRWGPLSSFLIYRLLEERPFLADPQNASRTQLWNLQSRTWEPELLTLFGIPPGHLPQCVPTRHRFGTLKHGRLRVPVNLVTGDQAAALFAHGPPSADTAYVNVGTGAFIIRTAAARPEGAERLLTGIVLEEAESLLFGLEGTVNGAAAALDWVGRELGRGDLLQRLPEWLAASGEPPLFLNGVSGLGSPFWRADFPSRFVGDGSAAEKTVAVVESIAFLLQANLEQMSGILPPPREIQLSGGLSRLEGFCRMLCDLSGLPLLRAEDFEATARGVACLLARCPEEWAEGTEFQRFGPRAGSPLAEALRSRYRRWRQEMATLTGI